ncbi:unnamed protein product, partial [marine sediment metagenome]
PITLSFILMGTASSDLVSANSSTNKYLGSLLTSSTKSGFPVFATHPVIPSSEIFTRFLIGNLIEEPLEALTTSSFDSSSSKRMLM